MEAIDIEDGIIHLDSLSVSGATTRTDLEDSGLFEVHGGDQLAEAKFTGDAIASHGASWSLFIILAHGHVRSAVLTSDLPEEEERMTLVQDMLVSAFGEREEFRSDSSIVFDTTWGTVSAFRCLQGESRGKDGNLRLRWQ